MKKNLSLLALVFLTLNLFAQDEAADSSKWEFGGLASLTFSQVSLYQWAAGGDPSTSGNALFNVFANYKDGTTSWINTLDMGYGLISQDGDSKKSDDRIEFNSQYGKKASKKWFYSAMLNFKTQFTDGENADGKRISTFMAPGYLTGSVGMDYRPNDKFQLFLSPVTAKLTFVSDDTLASIGAFGVEADKNFRAELGGYAKIAYKSAILENVDLKTKMDFFANYQSISSLEDVDVNWEVLLAMKINEFLSATLFTNMIWDNDIKQVEVENAENESGIQVKSVFGVGLSYKF